MSDYRTFTREDRDGVAVVSFQHPPINLIDRAMVIDLLHLADELERDGDTRVVLFRSANPDFFLAHYDLGSQLDAPPMKLPAGMVSPLSALFSRFSRLPQVTIGELSGRARGAGSEFLLALDMRFASRERALLGQPEVAVGLLPGAGGTVRLAQLLGRGRALEVCLGGEDFDADTAERYGWINRAVADAELGDFCDRLARRIATFPAAGVAHVKAVVEQVVAADQTALVEESQRFVGDMSAPGTVERVRWMMDNGGQRDGELERDLGAALGRYPQAVD
ncbi:enoyl-CoA hydratase/isomerase family protein [Pseudomonas sp. PDNC002]|uniref:enoyl-CoA hydratase/isomerase family protein n=1 Tax=Pseudomonas sp. PDNC002 TaxID=2811422 RepID=UPI00196258C1|nr:enoyl-CoA hydratase/isomerase family protein [Pseudomonas sp. PDNC002]QRY82215.1 enoyl-CoA hydratase/isomerase family protein [Pseudomonas sp. PDNC002]